MYLLIIQWSIISLFLIVLIHYLYGFFQTTLTRPKIKDLVNRPASAYKEMYNTINNDYHSGNNKDSQLNKNTNANKNNYPQNSESTNSTNQPSSTNQNMKDELKSFLMKNGVDAKVHYPTPIHLQPAAKYLNYKKGDFPIAEKLAKQTLSLPVHEFIKTKDIKRIASLINNFYLNKI